MTPVGPSERTTPDVLLQPCAGRRVGSRLGVLRLDLSEDPLHELGPGPRLFTGGQDFRPFGRLAPAASPFWPLDTAPQPRASVLLPRSRIKWLPSTRLVPMRLLKALTGGSSSRVRMSELGVQRT